MASAPAAEPWSQTPREDFWVPDGTVYSVLVTNGVAYVGGDFRFVGPSKGGVVALDVDSGEQLTGFPRVEGAVFCVFPDGLGGRYIGGSFVAAGGVNCTNVAHVLADGSVDSHWQPQVLGEGVRTLAVFEGLVFIGGNFTNVAGVPRNALAAVDAATGVAVAWRPDPNNPVRCMEIIPELRMVVVGGEFTFISGYARSGVAAISTTTAALSFWDPAPNGPVLAMARLGPWLYVAGRFTTIGGAFRSGLAAVDTFWGFATAWDPQANNPVEALGVTCSTVFAAGSFTMIGRQQRNFVAAVDAFSGVVLPWNAGIDLDVSFVGGVSALAGRDDTIYIGGRFSSVGGQPRSGIAAVDAMSGQVQNWNPAAGGAVNVFALSGNALLVGGQAVSFGGKPRRFLAAFDTATGQLTDWNPGANGIVTALAQAGDTVYVGGAFLKVGGAQRVGLAAVKTDGRLMDWNPGTDGPVWRFAMSDNTLYVGGGFTQVAGAARSRLAAFDLAAGTLRPWNPTANNTVFSVALSGNTLYAGGEFTGVNNLARSGLAAIDATAGSLQAWFAAVNGPVTSLAIAGSTIYAGGEFTTVNGVFRPGLAAINPFGLATTWNPQLNGPVYALQLFDQELLVGGAFSTVGAKTNQPAVALFDRVTGELRAWNPRPSQGVRALAVDRGNMYVGGDFLGIGSRSRSGLGVFRSPGAPVVTLPPMPLTLRAGEALNLEVEAVGEMPMSFGWHRNGTRISGATNPTYQLARAGLEASGRYEVFVSNRLGLAVSESVSVLIYEPIVIVRQPLSQSVTPGTAIEFTVVALGTPAPTYQWRLNGVNIPGARGPVLQLGAVQPTNSGSYSVVIANAGGAVSSAVANLHVSAPELNLADRFSNRTLAVTPSGAGWSSNGTAARESGEPQHAGKTGGASVWLAWRAPSDGLVIFHTRGSDFDTLLAAYRGSQLAALVELAGDDDQAGHLASQVTFEAVANTDYAIAVDGLGGARGAVLLSWRLDPTVTVLPRITRQPRSLVVAPGQNATFSVEIATGIPIRFQWFNNCAALFYATNATLTISNVYPSQAGMYWVAVYNVFYSVPSQPAFLEFGAADKSVSKDKFQDLFEEEPQAGSGGAALTSLGQKSSFSSVAAGVPYSQVLNNFGATTELGEPNHGGAPGGASRWFRLRAEVSGTMVLDTLGSEIDTVMAVYQGASLLDLKLVASDNNSGSDGTSAALSFPAQNGVDYLVAVDGVNGALGAIRLNWRLQTGAGLLLRLTDWRQLNDGRFRFQVSGAQAPRYWVQVSTNLPFWRTLSTNLPVNASFEYVDPATEPQPRRFFRVRPAP